MLAIGLAVGGALGVLLMVIGLQQMMAPEIDVGARLDHFVGRDAAARRGAGAPADGTKPGPLVASMERALAGRNFAASISRDLARANLKLTVSEYLIIHFLLVLGLGAVAFLITRNGLGSLVIGLVGLVLPRLYVSYRQQARLNAFNNQLSDTCSLLANGLRSGYSLLQSMEMVAREGPEPTASEFQRVVREVSFGLSPEQALANLVRRVDSPDLDLMVTAINVQHEVGGNLAQILDSIGNTIRERVRVKGEIKTLTSTVSCSGNAVSVLPVGITGILFLINPDYISQIFQPGWVLCLPAAGAGGIILGYTVMRKITDIDV